MTSTSRHPSDAVADARRGFTLAIPLMLGYLPVAIAFGVLAGVQQLPAWAAVAMSTVVYGAASQFAALQLLATGGGIGSVVATTFVVNLRHLLLAAAIAPRVRDYGPAGAAAFGAQLTDECFAVHSTQFRARPTRPRTEVFAMNTSVHLSWIGGTVIGIAFGGAIPAIDRMGLDFALSAMFLAILVQDAITRIIDVLVAVLGGGFAVGLTCIGSSLWAVVVATIAAATVGFLVDRDDPAADAIGDGAEQP